MVAQDKATAIRFIRACGNIAYESHLKKKFLDGENAFPSTLADARAIMEQQSEHAVSNVPVDSGTGVALVTGGVTPKEAGCVSDVDHQVTWWLSAHRHLVMQGNWQGMVRLACRMHWTVVIKQKSHMSFQSPRE